MVENKLTKLGAAALVGLLVGGAGVAFFEKEQPAVDVPTADEIAAAVVKAQGTSAPSVDIGPLVLKLEEIRKLVVDNEPVFEDAAKEILLLDLDEDDFRDAINDDGKYEIDEDEDLSWNINRIDVDFADFNDEDFTGEARVRVRFHDEKSGEDKSILVDVEFDINDGDLDDFEITV